MTNFSGPRPFFRTASGSGVWVKSRFLIYSSSAIRMLFSYFPNWLSTVPSDLWQELLCFQTSPLLIFYLSLWHELFSIVHHYTHLYTSIDQTFRCTARSAKAPCPPPFWKLWWWAISGLPHP